MYFYRTFDEKIDKYLEEKDENKTKICSSWTSARMKALSRLPYEGLNHFLRKIDKHFEGLLRKTS